jgi:hypothetical protein
MIISIKRVNRLSIYEAVADFPVNELTFLLLLTDDIDPVAFARKYHAELQSPKVFVYVLPKGAVLQGVFASPAVPMIASFINYNPIAKAGLAENLDEFFKSSFGLAEMILRETEI